MKRLLFTFAFILSVLNLQAADISSITNALKAGNAPSLIAAMDAETDIALPDYSKKGNGETATSALSNFFQTNKPNDFSVVHHADKKDSGFFVGKFITADKSFRVNVTYKVEGNKIVIQSIRIE